MCVCRRWGIKRNGVHFASNFRFRHTHITNIDMRRICIFINRWLIDKINISYIIYNSRLIGETGRKNLSLNF